MTRKEYNTIVDTCADGLYLFMLKNSHDEDTAKDLVQESFARLWEKHEDIEHPKAKSYLFTTGYRCFIDHTRLMKKTTNMTEHTPVPSSNEQYSDLKEILDKALNLLPPDQKSVILLRDYEGYNYQEIGEILNLTESQVKVYIFRGRKFLKNYLIQIEAVN